MAENKEYKRNPNMCIKQTITKLCKALGLVSWPTEPGSDQYAARPHMGLVHNMETEGSVGLFLMAPKDQAHLMVVSRF